MPLNEESEAASQRAAHDDDGSDGNSLAATECDSDVNSVAADSDAKEDDPDWYSVIAENGSDTEKELPVEKQRPSPPSAAPRPPRRPQPPWHQLMRLQVESWHVQRLYRKFSAVQSAWERLEEALQAISNSNTTSEAVRCINEAITNPKATETSPAIRRLNEAIVSLKDTNTAEGIGLDIETLTTADGTDKFHWTLTMDNILPLAQGEARHRDQLLCSAFWKGLKRDLLMTPPRTLN